MKTITSWIIYGFFLIGVLLIVTNIIGFFAPLRTAALVSEINSINKNDLTLSEDQVYSAINSEVTDKKSYARFMNTTINQGMAHYWEDDGIEKYNLRVPFDKNYILFTAGILLPDKFRKYEFMDYKLGLERGVGLCSQQSIILSEILFRKGYDTRIVMLSGHVVTTALVDEKSNEWWLLDPDYGVVVPENIEAIENNPELIAPYYSERGYDDSTIAMMESLYNRDGNSITTGNGEGNYSLIRYYFEKASYILIWVIPFLFMLPVICFQLKKLKEKVH